MPYVAQTIDTDPQAVWVFITDQLNIHQSESLVHLVAARCGLTDELGSKGKSGVLGSLPSRAAFLSDPTHRIQFVYVPKHTSWLNQVEIWLGILVRRVIKRGNFTSLEDLRTKISSWYGGKMGGCIKAQKVRYTNSAQHQPPGDLLSLGQLQPGTFQPFGLITN